MNGNGKALALWSALAAFFGAILSFEAVGLIVSGENIRVGISAVITAGAVGGSVYAKTRRDAVNAAKRDRETRRGRAK